MVSAAVPWLVMLTIAGVLVAAFPVIGVLAVASGLAVVVGTRNRKR